MKFSTALTIPLLSLLPIHIGQAVTVARPVGNDISNHEIAPSNGAPWDNVLQVDSASGVYLGGGWVLTAEHVHDNASPAQVTYNGTTYSEDTSRTLVIQESGDTDLVLFRLETTIVGLSSISIGTINTTDASDVTLIGRGGGIKRWGTNNVTIKNLKLSIEGNLTTLFSTEYDSTIKGEGHLISGDSGGGVFHQNEGTWELAGIMSAVGLPPNENLAFSVQLQDYQTQITNFMTLHGSAPVPEPSSTALLGVAACGFILRRKRA